jgi:hypothetical protein
MRIDVIDLLIGGDDEGSDDMDKLAKILFGKEDEHLGQVLAALISRRRDPRRTIDVIQRMINDPDFHTAVNPVTERTLVELPENAVYIGSQGAPDTDRHVHFLVKHPEKEEWALHIACPKSKSVQTVGSFTGDQKLAVHKANIFLDIGYGKMKPEGLIDKIIKKWKDEKKAAAATKEE